MKRANPVKRICPFLKTIITVGTPVTRRAPNRSQRSELPHWAPAFGKDAQALFRIANIVSKVCQYAITMAVDEAEAEKKAIKELHQDRDVKAVMEIYYKLDGVEIIEVVCIKGSLEGHTIIILWAVFFAPLYIGKFFNFQNKSKDSYDSHEIYCYIAVF